MEEISGSFGKVDYVIFGIVLAISASIGIYYRFTGGRQKTLKASYKFVFYNYMLLIIYIKTKALV